MHSLRLLLVVLTVSLVGGVSTSPVVKADFRGIEPPSAGYTRIYVFRPAFAPVSHSDAPWVELDGARLFRLAYGSYTQVQAKGGSHRLSLRPEKFEDKIWLSDYEFTVEPDQTYFLAIWNDAKFTRGTSIQFIPVIGIGLLPLVQTRTEIENKALRLEFVSREDALPLLEQSRYVDSPAGTSQ